MKSHLMLWLQKKSGQWVIINYKEKEKKMSQEADDPAEVQSSMESLT